MSMKNYNDTIGYRSRDFQTCSAVPQTTAPPAACPMLGIKRVSRKIETNNTFTILKKNEKEE